MKTIAVDIGNTYTHLGLNREGEWLYRLYLPTEKDPANWLSFLFDHKPDRAILSSVVPDATTIWTKTLERFSKDVILLRYSDSLGIKVLYDNPLSLGTDRLANALYALSTNENLIVVDIGTAITVDAIGNGTFYGGAILPGLSSSLNALSKEAAQLKGVYFEYTLNKSPGRSTWECVSKGVLLGTFHAIVGTAKEMADTLNWKKWRCLVTGGGAAPFFPLFEPLGWQFRPTLTLDGLLIALKRLQKVHNADK